jgi:hypothetical protein
MSQDHSTNNFKLNHSTQAQALPDPSRPDSGGACVVFGTSCSFLWSTVYKMGYSKGGRLIRLVHRGICTDQVFFLLGIEPGVFRIRPWNEFLLFGSSNLVKIHIYCFATFDDPMWDIMET